MYEKLRKVRVITDQFCEEAAQVKKRPSESKTKIKLPFRALLLEVEHLQRMMQQVESLLTQYKADECIM